MVTVSNDGFFWSTAPLARRAGDLGSTPMRGPVPDARATISPAANPEVPGSTTGVGALA